MNSASKIILRIFLQALIQQKLSDKQLYIQYVLQYVYLILFLHRMLDKEDLQKFIKPLLASYIFNALLFISIPIVILAYRITGFSQNGFLAPTCNNYLDAKNSHYNRVASSAMFIASLLGSFLSGLNLIVYLIYYRSLKKEHNLKLQQEARLSEKSLRLYFACTFLESICVINILIRSCQRLKQSSVCNLPTSITDILFTILASVIVIGLGVNCFILFRLLFLFEKKIMTLKEYNLYSEQMSLKENLFFNKNGYIRQLLKTQNQQVHSNSLKEDLLKKFPSGYKKSDLSSTRQIIHKLRGGSNNPNIKKSEGENDNKDEALNNKQINQGKKDDAQSSKKNQQEKQPPSEKQNNSQNHLLSVYPGFFCQTPNSENLQAIQTAMNVIQLTVDGNKEQLKSEEQSNDEKEKGKYDKELQSAPKKTNLFRQKKGKASAEQLNKLAQEYTQKKNKVPFQLKIEESLKQNFNLTPNLELRQRHSRIKNVQNIDDNGNYFFIDVQKVKKKSKYLSLEYLGDQSDKVHPNDLYSRGSWVPKKKRVAKKHERNVQEYLRELSRIRKQEMLCEDFDESFYTDSFEDSELSSEIKSSDYEDDEPHDQNINAVQQNDNIERQKNSIPELYLYIKRKKVTKIPNLRLFSEIEGFYDENSQNQSSKEHSFVFNQKNIEGYYEKNNVSKEKKNTTEDKINSKNKVGQNEEAEMLKMIRQKYIQPGQSKQKFKQQTGQPA